MKKKQHFNKGIVIWLGILSLITISGLIYTFTRPAPDDPLGATNLMVFQGGTGTASFDKYDVVIATSDNVLGNIASGSEGQVLEMLDNGIPGWGTDDTGAGTAVAHDLLSDTHSDSTEASASQGSMIYADAADSWKEFVVGASSSFISTDGTDVLWLADPTVASMGITNLWTSTFIGTHASLSNDLTASGSDSYIRLLTDDTTDPSLYFETNNTGHEMRFYLDESTAAANDTMILDCPKEADNVNYYIKAADTYAATIGLYSGSNWSYMRKEADDNLLIDALTEDADIIFEIDDGGTDKMITIDGATFTIQSSTGLFDFNDDNLTTTGIISGAGASVSDALTVGAGGIQTASVSATNFYGALTGNASTATALADNGADCNAGEYPLGVDASGAVENCTDATTEINSEIGNVLDGTDAFTDFNGADIIDTDNLNWGNFTDLGEDGTVTWGNVGAGELGNDSIINEDIDDDGTFAFTGPWSFSHVSVSDDFEAASANLTSASIGTLVLINDLDISDYTNLTAGDHITLTDDDLDVDDDFLLNTGDSGTWASMTVGFTAVEANITSLSADTYWGAGLVDCDGDTQTLGWSDTGVFVCGDDDTAAGGLSVHHLLSDIHNDTVEASVSQGSIIVGNGTPAWAEVAVGASGSFVGYNGADTLFVNQTGNIEVYGTASVSGNTHLDAYLYMGEGIYLENNELISNNVAGTVIIDGGENNVVLQLGTSGNDSQLDLFSEQGGTDFIASLHHNAVMTSDADFYLPADEPAATQFLIMTSGGVMQFGPAASTSIHLAADQTFTLDGVASVSGTIWAGGNVTTTGTLEAATITEGGVAVLNNDEMDASAELLAIFDDETGTGNIVFSNNPTFTGASVSDDFTIGAGGLYTASISGATISGFNLTDCDGDTQTLGWDDTNKTFTCGDDDTAAGAAVSHDLMYADVHTDTQNASSSAGDIIIGSQVGDSWDILSIGSTDFVLQSDGASLSWANIEEVVSDGIDFEEMADAMTLDADWHILSTNDIYASGSLWLDEAASISTTLQVGGNITTTGTMEAATITEGGVAVLNNDEMDASAELLNIFDDETGSGLIVFATSPQFTTSFTTAGAFAINPGGALTIGDGGDTLTLNSSDWDISATGDITNIGAITMDGILRVASSSAIFGGAVDFDSTASTSGNWTINTGAWNLGSATSFELPNAAAPTVDANGEVAFDDTAFQFVWYQGGEVQAISASDSFSFVVQPASRSANFLIMKVYEDITIVGIHCIVDPASSSLDWSIDIQECDSTGDNCATVDDAIDCDEDGETDDGSFSNGTIDAGDWIMASISEGQISGDPIVHTTTVYFKETRK